MISKVFLLFLISIVLSKANDFSIKKGGKFEEDKVKYLRSISDPKFEFFTQGLLQSHFTPKGEEPREYVEYVFCIEAGRLTIKTDKDNIIKIIDLTFYEDDQEYVMILSHFFISNDLSKQNENPNQ